MGVDVQPQTIRVLLVEDDPLDAALVERALAAWTHPHTLVPLARLSEGAALAGEVDVVLLDLELSDSSGPESLAALSGAFAEIPVVVLTGVADAATALHAIHAGAQDFLVKGTFDGTTLARTLVHARERFRARRELRRRADTLEANLRAVVNRSGDGMLILDGASVVLFANARAVRDVGARVGERSPLTVSAGEMADAPLPDGRVLEVLAEPTTWLGRPAVLATLRDVTQQREETRALHRTTIDLTARGQDLDRITMEDPLTGLLNRRGAERTMERESTHTRGAREMACILIDLDNFKDVNDQLGHAAGDQALTALSATLRTSVRPGDYVARVGGDEFAVLLPGAGQAEALRVAERIREAVSVAPIETACGQARLTCSVGVAPLPDGARTIGDVLQAADDALSLSKTGGKNRASTPPPAGPLESGVVVRLSDGDALGRVIDVGSDVGALHAALASAVDVLQVHVHAKALAAGGAIPARIGREEAAVVAVGAAPIPLLVPARQAIRDAGLLFGLGTGWTLESVVCLQPDLVAIDARWTLGVARQAERLTQLRRLVTAVTALGAEPFATGFSREDREHLAALGILRGVC